MEILSLIGSGLAILLVVLKEFFDSRRRKRLAEEEKRKIQDSEQKVLENVLFRLGKLGKQENANVSDVEDHMDEELIGKNRTPEKS